MKKQLTMTFAALALFATGAHATCTTVSNTMGLGQNQYQVINNSSATVSVYAAELNSYDKEELEGYKKTGKIEETLKANAKNYKQYDLYSDMDYEQLSQSQRVESNDNINTICGYSGSKNNMLASLGCCVDEGNNFNQVTVRFTDGNTKTSISKEHRKSETKRRHVSRHHSSNPQ